MLHVMLLRHARALSPYAQALKQVALQGAVALGPSAREMELAMYRNGTLQADYRPPVHGKWDDTIERWAYAWQFPPSEDGDGEDAVTAVMRNRSGFARLLTFCAKLARSPPSTRPGSAVHSPLYAMLCCTDTSAQQKLDNASTSTRLPSPLSSSSSSPSLPSLLVDFTTIESSLRMLQEQQQHDETSLSAVPTASDGEARCAENEARMCMMPASQYAHEVGVPVAYLDDKSERSSASRELHAVLDNVGLDYTEDGLVVAVAALSRQQHDTAARALFVFARDVGLGPCAELYKALMLAPAERGDVNTTMALIEEMKQCGVTPRIGNWHVLMRAFHVARDYAAVSQIVDMMKMYANIEPNERTFVLQLRALAKDTTQQNALAEAVQLFDQMENVYGYIAARPHYDALMYALSHGAAAPEMRLRCEELAHKMRLMGIAWNGVTYLNLIRAAQVSGDVAAVERLLARMRDERIPMTLLHLSWSIHAHVQHLLRIDYDALQASDAYVRGVNNDNKHSSSSSSSSIGGSEEVIAARNDGAEHAILSKWLEHMNVCFGIYELVVQRRWAMQLPLLNALLRLCCQLTILAMEHMPDRVDVAGRFEEQATRLWSRGFDEWALTRDTYSYECYIALLAHQQRIDEAEALFQQMVLQHDMTPTRRTYECLLFMHLSSGDEGGAARALRYLEAMEQARLPIRASLLRKVVRVHDAAGYRRDMKRRARRIMQAREEYMARKAEQQSDAFDDVDTMAPPRDDYNSSNEDDETALTTRTTTTATATASSSSSSSHDDSLAPLPLRRDSTLAWWQRWRATTLSKHELFEKEGDDGMPRGGDFAEKNAALAKLGIRSPYTHPRDVPTSSTAARNASPRRLLPTLSAAEGEVAGALWALDGGELSYPRDGGGPAGWGVRLWRERTLLRAEFAKTLSGDGGGGGGDSGSNSTKAAGAMTSATTPFSSLGVASRPAKEQLDIAASGARTPGELTDWRQLPQHRYDDTGAAKPASELATAVSPSAELVWRGEARDALAAYKTDAELALESDNVFYAQLERSTDAATRATLHALQTRQEDDMAVVGRGTTRHSRYDYLEKWRDMYRHGTLDVPTAPLLRFGRSADDHRETMAASVRAWLTRQQRRTLPSDAQRVHDAVATTRAAEARGAHAALRSTRQPRRRRHSSRIVTSSTATTEQTRT